MNVQAALLDPPDFDPNKLEVIRLGAEEPPSPPNNSSKSTMDSDASTFRRRYTLTHNDLTGFLTLSVGETYNSEQLSGWYTKILRDEVLAELIAVEGSYELNVYCHVSGEAKWLAPAGLRSFIFLREMTLVLETIAYADRELITSDPVLEEALVYVHLASDLEPLNKKIEWGRLGDKRTWKRRRNDAKRNLVDVIFSTDLDEDDYDGDIVFETTSNAAEYVALNSKE